MTTININGTDCNFLSRPSFKGFDAPTFYVARDSGRLRCVAYASVCASCQFSKKHQRQTCGAVIHNIVKAQYPEIFL